MEDVTSILASPLDDLLPVGAVGSLLIATVSRTRLGCVREAQCSVLPGRP